MGVLYKRLDQKNGAGTVRLSSVRESHHNRPPELAINLQRSYGNQGIQKLLRHHGIRAKLTIGQPGDSYEQEADRIADRVMTMPDALIQPEGLRAENETVQLKPLTITPPMPRRKDDEPEKKIQAKSDIKLYTSLIQRQAEEKIEPPSEPFEFEDLSEEQKRQVVDAIWGARIAIVRAKALLGSLDIKGLRAAQEAFKVKSFDVTEDVNAIHTVIKTYSAIDTALNRGGIEFEGVLRPRSKKSGYVYNGLLKLFDDAIHIVFPKFSQLTEISRINTIIHELAHNVAGCKDYAYYSNPEWQSLTRSTAINNADSYSLFATYQKPPSVTLPMPDVPRMSMPQMQRQINKQGKEECGNEPLRRKPNPDQKSGFGIDLTLRPREEVKIIIPPPPIPETPEPPDKCPDASTARNKIRESGIQSETENRMRRSINLHRSRASVHEAVKLTDSMIKKADKAIKDEFSGMLPGRTSFASPTVITRKSPADFAMHRIPDDNAARESIGETAIKTKPDVLQQLCITKPDDPLYPVLISEVADPLLQRLTISFVRDFETSRIGGETEHTYSGGKWSRHVNIPNEHMHMGHILVHEAIHYYVHDTFYTTADGHPLEKQLTEGGAEYLARLVIHGRLSGDPTFKINYDAYQNEFSYVNTYLGLRSFPLAYFKGYVDLLGLTPKTTPGPAPKSDEKTRTP